LFKLYISLFILSSTLMAAPSWYANQSYKSHNQTYYGYGEGRSQKEARQHAFVEISEQIQVDISSELHINRKSENQKNSHSIKNSIQSKSSAILKEMKIVDKCQEKSRHYVVLEYNYTTPLWYELRLVETPLFSKTGYGVSHNYATAIENAKKDLRSQSGVADEKSMTSVKPIKSEKIGSSYFIAVVHQELPTLACNTPIQNAFLSKSSLIQEANRLTQCPYDYQLSYINEKWHLKYKTIFETLSEKDFATFFVTVSNDNISLKSSKNSFREGEGFHLLLSAQKDGYISLFNVYEDGKVGLIFENEKISKKREIIFPSATSGQEFVATLNTPNEATKDLYFVIYSPKKVDLSYFEEQSSNLVSKKEFRFNDVLKLCEDKEFATIVLQTKPKKVQ